MSDHSELLDTLRQEADANIAESAFTLGLFYQHGKGVEKDMAQAIFYFEKSANMGDELAKYTLANIYIDEQQEPTNKVKGFELLLELAENDAVTAQCDLGYCYEQGIGTSSDINKAIFWYKKAANQNNTLAQVNLGCLYEKGIHVERDVSEAIFWFQKAAEKNDEFAENALQYLTDNTPEKSPGGSTIRRHEEPSFNKEEVSNLLLKKKDLRQNIMSHVEQSIGKISRILPVVVTPEIEIDILIIAPTQNRNYYTLLTCGMSSLPMPVSDPSLEPYQFAELVICLPSDWPLSDEALKDEKNYWPINLLSMLAILPHQYRTWIWYSHSIPNGPEKLPPAYAENTKMNSVVLISPVTLPEDLIEFPIDNDKTIFFLGVCPIYQEEMDLKLKKGFDALEKRFMKYNISELLDIKRRNIAKLFSIF